MDRKTLIILIPLVILIIVWWPLLEWLGLVKPPAPPQPADTGASPVAVDTAPAVPPPP